MQSVRLCLTFSLIFLLATLLNALLTRNKLPQEPHKFTIEKNVQMEFLLGNDTAYLQLHKGDSVKFLGYRTARYYNPHSFLVETYDGQRGFIRLADLGLPFVKEKTGDTVYVKNIDAKKRKYIYDDKEGKDKEIGYKVIYPVLSDTLPYLVIYNHGEYYMSPKKFEQLFIGKSIDEVDNNYHPATQIYRDKKGARVSFQEYCILDKQKGYFRYPVVTYNDSLIATEYTLVSSINTNNKFFIKILPFIAPILDCHLLSSQIQDSFYGAAVPGMTLSKADNPNALMWIYTILALICRMVWMFCFCALPVFLMGYLIRFRHLFYPFNDRVLAYLVAIVALLSCYVWIVLMLSWGMLWFFTPLILVGQFWAAGVATIPLNNAKPHARCPHCRRLYTIAESYTDPVKEYDKWENRSFREQSYVSGERRWKTWTETKWSDGSTTTSNNKRHKQVTTTHINGDYRCLVHYRIIDTHFTCKCCGFDEVQTATFDDILEKTKTGEHTSSDTYTTTY